MKNILKIVQILLLAILVSCSSDDNDIKDAISVFKYSNELKIDESLQGKDNKIPAQQVNKFWFGRLNLKIFVMYN